MAPKTSPALLQSRLSFTTSKRSAADANVVGGKNIKSLVSEPKLRAPAVLQVSKQVLEVSSSEDEDDDDKISEKRVSSDSESDVIGDVGQDEVSDDSDEIQVQVVIKERKPQTVAEALKEKRERKVSLKKIEMDSIKEDAVDDEEDSGEPDLKKLEKTARVVREFGRAREKMGNLAPIHTEGQTKVHHILRVFDLSSEYGPAIGVTRLERWNRAHKMGLNPPPEVKELLMTKQAQQDDSLKFNVLHSEV